MTIYFYSDHEPTYAGFSNFSNHGFELDGYYWKTNEHFFQAQKYKGTPYFEEARLMNTPKEVAYFGRKYPLPDGWREQRYSVMKRGVLQKFRSHPDLLQLLLSTGTEEIVEDNPKDEIWANGKEGKGQNLFGKLLMEVRDYFRQVMKEEVAALKSEGTLENVSTFNQLQRKELAFHFRQLPHEFFTNVRHFQPQVGCLNRCSFCSQSAGTSIWHLTKSGIKNVVAALLVVALNHAKQHFIGDEPYISSSVVLDEHGRLPKDFVFPSYGLIGYGRVEHRPGVLFCYLDNDISVYPYIHEYVREAWENLGVKIRVSTVGYSRKSKELQDSHLSLNENSVEGLAGVRLSITPYTYGWTKQGEKSGLTSRIEFKKDIANFLKVYRPAIDHLGVGQRTGCVELRFSTLYEAKQRFEDVVVDGYHLIHVGPYVLRSLERYSKPKTSTIRIDEEKRLILSEEPLYYELYEDDCLRNKTNEEVFENINQLVPRIVDLYQVENLDGPYYVTEPFMTNQGFYARHFYPKTNRRPSSGFIDSERLFLNTLVQVKQEMGYYDRRSVIDKATWADVEKVVETFKEKARELDLVHKEKSRYMTEVMLPIIEMYIAALRETDYDASYFFHPKFTIDTGGICNLGQAYFEFKDLVSKPNLPLTTQQERSFGNNSSLAIEGKVWRISVTPYASYDEKTRTNVIGKRNIATTEPCLLIEEQDLAKQADSCAEGPVTKRVVIPLQGIEKVNMSQGIQNHYMIGQTDKNTF